MTARSAIWMGVLASSLAANVYLAYAHFSAVEPASAPAMPEPAPPPPPRRAAPAPPKLEVPTAYATLDRPALEHRLVEVEARVAELLPDNEKFALTSERSSENEARVKPYLDNVFKDFEGAEPKYTVECHGRVCKLDVNVGGSAWWEPLQTNPGHVAFGFSFGREGTYVRLLEPEQARQSLLFEALRDAIGRSPVVATCKPHTALSGDLTLDVYVDPGTRTWITELYGALAKTDFAECLRITSQAALARVPIPPDFAHQKWKLFELHLPVK